MSEGQWLFAVFATLYLVECLRWLPAAAVVFTGLGSRWHTRRPWSQLEFASLSPVALPFLPPLQAHLITLPWLLVPCAEGLEVGADDTKTLVIPWDSLAPVADAQNLRLSPDHTIRLVDQRLAQEWQKRLLAWPGMSAQARDKDFLKHARRTLDTKAPAQVAASLTAGTRGLRWLGAFILFWTFGVITGIYRWYGEGLEIFAAAGVLFLSLWIQAVVFWRATRQLEHPVPHRLWKTLAMAFLPQNAIRAADLICRAQPIVFHPLAARELLDEAAWKALATDLWKQARHGRAKSSGLQMQALEAFFRQHGITPSELEQVPQREEGSLAYCPRCLAQFRQADALCQDCGGLALSTWPAA